MPVETIMAGPVPFCWLAVGSSVAMYWGEQTETALLRSIGL
jgi:hypothetical protein